MKHKGIIVLIILVVFSSCKKEPKAEAKGTDCSVKETTYISSEISNFKFKQGTYWVFMDSIALTIDTMKVWSAGGDFVPYTYCKTIFHEVYGFKVTPTYYSYSLEGNRLMRNQRSEDGDADEIFIGGAAKTDSMFIYDRYYKSVGRYVKQYDETGHGIKTAYFMNTDFGFLKIEEYSASNQLVSKRLLKDKFIVR